MAKTANRTTGRGGPAACDALAIGPGREPSLDSTMRPFRGGQLRAGRPSFLMVSSQATVRLTVSLTAGSRAGEGAASASIRTPSACYAEHPRPGRRRSRALGALVAFVFGAFAWAAAATAVTALIPTVEAAAPTFLLIYFPVILVSGIFGSISEPHWLSAAQDRWRAVNAPHLVALVRAGLRAAPVAVLEFDFEPGAAAS